MLCGVDCCSDRETIDSNRVTRRFTFLYSGMNKLHSSILNYPAVLLNAALSVMQPAFVSIITCFFISQSRLIQAVKSLNNNNYYYVGITAYFSQN